MVDDRRAPSDRGLCAWFWFRASFSRHAIAGTQAYVNKQLDRRFEAFSLVRPLPRPRFTLHLSPPFDDHVLRSPCFSFRAFCLCRERWNRTDRPSASSASSAGGEVAYHGIDNIRTSSSFPYLLIFSPSRSVTATGADVVEESAAGTKPISRRPQGNACLAVVASFRRRLPPGHDDVDDLDFVEHRHPDAIDDGCCRVEGKAQVLQ